MHYFFSFLLMCLLFTSASFAQNSTKPKKSAHKVVKSAKAPQPIGPYSQGIMANGFLFVAGQVGANPETRQLVTESFEAEAKQVMENLQAILNEAGLDFNNVVKTTIYMKDISQFSKVNEIYGKYFTAAPPARETVQVANLPGGANVEISVIAAVE